MIKAVQLRKQYVMGESLVNALDGVDLVITEGQFVSIVGASGSGKSTLMHILGCLDRPTSGTLEFDGQIVSAMKENELSSLRNGRIGFVFQTFNLINRTSALDNVCLPLVYTRKPVRKADARNALDRVGLKQRAKHTPSELSGGECQRVAIARAIVNSPKLILADEPTGNLDSRTGEQIMRIFHELHDEGITIVLVTHEMAIAAQTERIIQMRDGLIVDDANVDDHHRAEIIASAGDDRSRLLRGKGSHASEIGRARKLSDADTSRKGS